MFLAARVSRDLRMDGPSRLNRWALWISLSRMASLARQAMQGIAERGEGWLVDDVMPGVDRELAGDQGCTCTVAVFDDFHKVVALRGGHALRPPVVQDQEIGLHELSEDAWEASIVMGELEF